MWEEIKGNRAYRLLNLFEYNIHHKTLKHFVFLLDPTCSMIYFQWNFVRSDAFSNCDDLFQCQQSLCNSCGHRDFVVLFLTGKVNHKVLTNLLSNIVFYYIPSNIEEFSTQGNTNCWLGKVHRWLSKNITSVNMSDLYTRNLKFVRQMFFASVGIWIHWRTQCRG